MKNNIVSIWELYFHPERRQPIRKGKFYASKEEATPENDSYYSAKEIKSIQVDGMYYILESEMPIHLEK